MDNNSRQTREAIEEAGKIFEKFGLTPMQGRIVAFFTMCNPPEKTFDELVRYFNASKSSVSNSLNSLLQKRIIDYKTFASDRKRYFYLTDLFLIVYFERMVLDTSRLREYSYRTVSMRSPEYPVASEKLLKWIEDANTFQEKIAEALKAVGVSRGLPQL